MTGHHDPDDVLDAVRQMEEDLQEIRRRARGGPAGLEEQIAELREESARERAALIEDLRLVVEVVATGWSRTARELESLRAEMGELRGMARGLAGAKLELKLAGDEAPRPTVAAAPTAPAAAPTAPPAAETVKRRAKGPARRVLPYPARVRPSERDVASGAERFDRPLYPVAEGG